MTVSIAVELAPTVVEVLLTSCCVESQCSCPGPTNILYDARLIGAVHRVPFVMVNDAVLVPVVIGFQLMVPLATAASNWLAEREQGATVFAATDTDTLELLFAWFGSVVLADTVAVFHNVELAVPTFAVAASASVAVELAERVPIVQVPVELA